MLKVPYRQLFIGAEVKFSTKINNSKELGQYLLEERKNLKLTQKEISEFTDVGRKFVLELEKGKATAQIGKIFEVLNGLGLEFHLIKRGDS
ncbi:MAG: helix-turn-helix transcriptional regulator [Deltaproteobacteria bacterium]|nr:helix-turn-helix transcriptional regulator [Deltaproteobacteria bacterium]